MSPIYSHSRLACFENCPKQFHYRYVLKIPSESESIEAFLGKRVHEVLERLHRFVARGLGFIAVGSGFLALNVRIPRRRGEARP